MSLPRYPAYKDSGVPWLGEVPAHWAVKRFKSIVAESKGGIWGEEPQGNDADIVCVRVADFDRVALRVRWRSLRYRNVLGVRREGRHLRRGDLLLEKSGGGEGQLVGCVVLYDHDVPAVCSNFIGRLGLVEGADPGYWAYVFASAYDVRLNYQSVRQTSGIQNLDQAEYLNEMAPIPPLAEQEAIAAFLDRETARVDALVAEQGRLIALLKEKRQAVISHAVTRGLNPDAPRKPSGVAWLGDVPAHWEVVALKRIATVNTGVAKGKDNSSRPTITVPYLRVANVQDGYLDLEVIAEIEIPASELERYALKRGDVLMNEGGDFDKLGRGCVWDGQIEPCITQNHVFAVRPRLVSSAWLSAVTGSSYAQFYFMTRSKQSTNLASISSTNLLELPVILPATGMSSRRSSTSLTVQTTAIDALIAEAERAIALLGERRAALIAAAVTGRVDVRGVAAGEGV